MGCVDCTLNRFGDIGGYLSYSSVGHHLKGVAFKSIRLMDSERIVGDGKIQKFLPSAILHLERCTDVEHRTIIVGFLRSGAYPGARFLRRCFCGRRMIRFRSSVI